MSYIIVNLLYFVQLRRSEFFPLGTTKTCIIVAASSLIDDLVGGAYHRRLVDLVDYCHRPPLGPLLL